MSNDREAVLLALEEAAQEVTRKLKILSEVLKEDALVCLSETHQQLDEALETLNLDSFASSYPGEFKESLVELNKKPSTLWETMKLDDEWKARLEAAVLDEREACARICRDLGRGHGVAFAEFDCVEAIRARGEFEEQEEYELLGRIFGTYGGRWVFIPDNKHFAWPEGMAVYARRIKR
jgi:hypothetical protein